MINDWNPVVFAELHGYMTEFLVEPCTPPHEPNLEYDLLVKNFALGSEAFGTAAWAPCRPPGGASRHPVLVLLHASAG